MVDHAPSLNAVTVALRIGERRARLVGLDVDAVRLREQITREVWATLSDRVEMALAVALDSAGAAAITDDVLDFVRPWLRRGAGPNPDDPDDLDDNGPDDPDDPNDRQGDPPA